MLDMHRVPKTIADLRRLADRYGLVLPETLVSVLDAEVPMPNLADVERDAVREITAAIGTKNADKVRDAALARVAAAQASARVVGEVNKATTLARWSAVRAHGDDLLALFREALADDLATLAECAGRVPLATTADSTGLGPDAFAARFEGEHIAARVEEVARLFAAIRGLPTSNTTARMFLARVPERLAGDDALALALAFEGARYGVQAGGTGIVQSPALWWVAAAAAGATFALVDADAVRATSERMREARAANQNRAERDRAGVLV